MSTRDRPLPWPSLHQGFALAKQLLSEIDSAEFFDDTQNFDLFAIADQIERAVMVEDEQVRRGVFLALADYLSASRECTLDIAKWEPCEAGGRSLLLRPLSLVGKGGEA